MQKVSRKDESIRIWLSALPSDRPWAEELARDLSERLRETQPKTEVEIGIPLDDGETCVLVATSTALDDEPMVTAWRHLARREGSTLIGLSEPDVRWPAWMERRVERLRIDPSGDGEYRVDLSKIISKYIGETEAIR